MVQFDEYDLLYKDYREGTPGYPDYVAIEDLELLNIQNKYHVIFFCDVYLKIFKMDKDVQNFRMVEKLVRQYNAGILVSKKELLGYVKANLATELSHCHQAYFS